MLRLNKIKDDLMYTYEADVIYVYNVNRFKARVDLGFNITKNQIFRFSNIINSIKDFTEDDKARVAEGKRKFLDLINRKPQLIRATMIDKDRPDQFIAELFVLPPEGFEINEDYMEMTSIGRSVNVKKYLLIKGYIKI